jgi:hypothetical protein
MMFPPPSVVDCLRAVLGLLVALSLLGLVGRVFSSRNRRP